MIIREAKQNDNDILQIAQVHLETWRTTYRGIFPDEYLANLSYEKRLNSWQKIFENASQNDDFIYVAENHSGQITGFANGGREPTGDLIYQGELKAIYIIENYQRQGVGRRLVKAIVARLIEAKIYSMLVWVLADNPACQFYEILGGKRIDSKQITRDRTILTEVAYGWTNIASLIVNN